MRLLNIHTFELQNFVPADIPKYVIASHRWVANHEATIQDITQRINTHKSGYKKVEGYVEYMKKSGTGVDWIWIDTCCVNQESSREVSEAVISMFRWYRDAEFCAVHLSDVETPNDQSAFKQSSWFHRGWTLQELIAPSCVVFLTQHWQTIGHKGQLSNERSGSSLSIGPCLDRTIAEITNIPESILRNERKGGVFDIGEALRWMEGRQTTLPEDTSYCLFGLLDVSLDVRYGEGESRARDRLIAEMMRAEPAKSRQFDVRHDTNRLAVPSFSGSGIFPLHDAVKQGDLKAIRKILLFSDVSIKSRDEQARTPLHWACSAEVADMLLDNGANVNVEDQDGQTPLHIAVMSRSLGVVKVLLLRGANKHKKDDLGRTPMDLASDCPAAMFMLRHGPGTEAADAGFRHNTGLIHMAWIGDLEGVRFYITQKAEIDRKNDDQCTALYEAARHGDLDSVMLLLDSGADIECQTTNSWPLLAAARWNRLSTVKILLSRGATIDTVKDGKTAISDASYHGNWEVVRILAERGAKLHLQDHDGYTPLHRAVHSGDVAIVKFLIQRQALLNVRAKDGRTPLHMACNPEHPFYLEKIEALLQSGADASIPCSQGYTPMSICARDGHTSIVELLLRYNVDAQRAADVSQAGAWSWTPLAEASHHYHVPIVQMLLRSGVDPNTRDGGLYTPLHWAVLADKRDPSIVNALIDHGADIEPRNKTGTTPLLHACDRGHLVNVRLLLAAGADVTKTANRGERSGLNSLMVCAQCGRDGSPAVLEMLIAHAPRLLDVQGKPQGRTALFHSVDNKTNRIVMCY